MAAWSRSLVRCLMLGVGLRFFRGAPCRRVEVCGRGPYTAPRPRCRLTCTAEAGAAPRCGSRLRLSPVGPPPGRGLFGLGSQTLGCMVCRRAAMADATCPVPCVPRGRQGSGRSPRVVAPVPSGHRGGVPPSPARLGALSLDCTTGGRPAMAGLSASVAGFMRARAG